MAAAAIQREQVSEAYERQKAYITQAVNQQRESTMSQVHGAQNGYAPQAQPPQGQDPAYAQAQAGAYPQMPGAGNFAVADELAQVIRQIIAAEVEAQLRALVEAQKQQPEEPQPAEPGSASQA